MTRMTTSLRVPRLPLPLGAQVVGDGIIRDANLVAEYRFNEGQGQVLTDYTGNGHDGQLGSTGGADADDPDWSAEGLVFTAANSDIVTCDTAGISGGAARTVIAAVFPNASGQFGIEWPGSGPNFERYTLRELGLSLLRLEVAGAGYTSTTLTITGEAWNFVAVTQSTSNLNTAVLYLNGASEAVTLDQVIDTKGNFTFGRSAGVFQEMRAAYGLVYNIALTADQIEQNRTALTNILAARGITLP